MVKILQWSNTGNKELFKRLFDALGPRGQKRGKGLLIDSQVAIRTLGDLTGLNEAEMMRIAIGAMQYVQNYPMLYLVMDE